MSRAAATLGMARLGMLGVSAASEPRQLAALRRATAWIPAARRPASLVERVVLVQFGTYTCINWLRTLPYVRAWARNYTGLTVIGVHTPEFLFEQNLGNVRDAIQGLQLSFPIAVDNDYAIWRAFDNHHWPALYLFDARGRIRHHQFGEGEYDRTETKVRQALEGAGVRQASHLAVPMVVSGIEAAADWRNLRTPEIYLGHNRTENFASPGGPAPGRRRVYRAPARLSLNSWALAGEWTLGPHAAVSNSAGGRVVCRFHARDVHLVMGPPRSDHPVRFRVSIDGQPPGPARGLDTEDSGVGIVQAQRLYQLVRQPGAIAERSVEIEFLDAGVEAFAFTFG
jgi:hypothetical protein